MKKTTALETIKNMGSEQIIAGTGRSESLGGVPQKGYYR